MASRCANPRAGDAGAAEVDQLGQQITRHITHRHPRRQHLVQHLHAAGPRPVFEAMLEPDAGRDLDSVLERYAAIPIGIYHTVGADALPIETITVVDGELAS
jgi:hypothetical protein